MHRTINDESDPSDANKTRVVRIQAGSHPFARHHIQKRRTPVSRVTLAREFQIARIMLLATD